MAYWRELFDSDAAETGTNFISLGVVAVVINAAIEAGVVTLSGKDRVSYGQGYEAGLRAAGELDLDDDEDDTSLSPDFDGGFYTQTPQGHTIHVNGDPNMPEETAQALRELGDKVHEMMSKKAEAEAPLMADAPDFDYTPHPPSRPLVPRRQLPDADVCREKLATALAAGTEAGQTLRAEIGVLAYNDRGVLIDPGKLKRTMSQHGTALPTVTELIAKVQDLAMAGVMPSMSSFNLNKPANWASATAHTERLGLSWSELAVQAGLKPNPCLPGKAG